MRSVSGQVAGQVFGRLLGAAVFLAPAGAAVAQSCPGHPDALGTSRTIAVDPAAHANIGTMQYPESLPLADHEVVITFDDGPLPRNSTPILDILDAECVKATYFLVGQMAQAYPKEVKLIQERGHTIGTHSFSHPLTFHRMSEEDASAQIDKGVAAVGAALGDPKQVAPFFRIPGLLRSKTVEDALAKRGIMNWSADFPADDWKHISAEEVTKRALARLEAKGRGILLLHDIHANTRAALPVILSELKRRGYKIVHVIPADAEHPATPTTPEQWIMKRPKPVPPVVAATPAPEGQATAKAVAQSTAPAARKKAARAARADKNKQHLSRHEQQTSARNGKVTQSKAAHGKTARAENKRIRTGASTADSQFGHALFDGDVDSTQSVTARPRLAPVEQPVAVMPAPPAPEKAAEAKPQSPFAAAAAWLRPLVP